MILSVLNKSLLRNQESARLTADKAAGSGTVLVDNISGFAVGKYVLFGNFGEPTAEIVRIHASSAPSGFTVTLASNTVQDHYAGTPVTVIDFNQVEFSRATTLAGSKSVLSTVSISADRDITIYDDLTNTTGYGFSRFKNSADTTYSDYSDGVNYTGNTAYSFGELVAEACSIAGVSIGDDYAAEHDLYKDVNAAQREITQMQDWDFELISDATSIGTTQNENEYALTSLTYAMKYSQANKAILDLRIGSSGPLTYLSPDEMDVALGGTKHGYLASSVSPAATSVTLADSNDFSESGTITLGQNTGVAYTANAQSTGVLSGISASSITVAVSSGGSVWQGVNPGLPDKYTIFGETLIFNAPVSSTYAGQKVKLKYIKKISDLNSFGDETVIPFFHCIPFYIAYRIETRKRNFDVAKGFYEQFMAIVNQNMDLHAAPTLDTTNYYEWGNGAAYGQV